LPLYIIIIDYLSLYDQTNMMEQYIAYKRATWNASK